MMCRCNCVHSRQNAHCAGRSPAGRSGSGGLSRSGCRSRRAAAGSGRGSRSTCGRRALSSSASLWHPLISATATGTFGALVLLTKMATSGAQRLKHNRGAVFGMGRLQQESLIESQHQLRCYVSAHT